MVSGRWVFFTLLSDSVGEADRIIEWRRFFVIYLFPRRSLDRYVGAVLGESRVETVDCLFLAASPTFLCRIELPNDRRLEIFFFRSLSDFPSREV